MTHLRIALIVGGLIAASTVTSSAVLAAPQHNCNNYAAMAVQDNEQNIAHGCGFGGARWQSNFAAHHGWCSQFDTTMADLSREHNRRRASLNSCKQKTAAKPGFRRPEHCGSQKTLRRIKKWGGFDTVTRLSKCKFRGKKGNAVRIVIWDLKRNWPKKMYLP